MNTTQTVQDHEKTWNEFNKDIRKALTRNNMGNYTGLPDDLVAQHLTGALNVLCKTLVKNREALQASLTKGVK